jgi:hypothetical protein
VTIDGGGIRGLVPDLNNLHPRHPRFVEAKLQVREETLSPA